MTKLHLLLAALVVLSACKSSLTIGGSQGKLLANDSISAAADSSLLAFIRPYSEELEREMGEIIIYSDEQMGKQLPESKLTNCLSDLFLENTRQLGSQLEGSPYPDVAYINYFSLRSSFPKGALSLGKLYEMFPFENQVVYLKISGENMLKFATITAQRGGDVLAGARLVISQSGGVHSFEINGEPLDKNKDYWIVTSDYVANGGDDMTMFLQPKKRIDSGFKIRDSFIDYMKEEHQAGHSLSGKLDGRISHEQ